MKSEAKRECTLWITNGPGEDGPNAAILDSRFGTLDTLISEHRRERNHGPPPETERPLGRDFALAGQSASSFSSPWFC